MIVNLIFIIFLSSALYCSTPTPNNHGIEDEDVSGLFTEEGQECLIFRYKNLKNFYSQNFEFFFTKALSLADDSLEKLLSKDEYYICFKEKKMTNEPQMDDIKTFFASLIDLKKDKSNEADISKKKELLKTYLPGIFYALLYAERRKATDTYVF